MCVPQGRLFEVSTECEPHCPFSFDCYCEKILKCLRVGKELIVDQVFDSHFGFKFIFAKMILF